jgi:uncharacterized protein (DUF169 family)
LWLFLQEEKGEKLMDLNKVNESLNLYIRPQTLPVAVRMLISNAEVTVKVRRPRCDMEMKMPVCQGIALSRRYGWKMMMGKEDISCPFGAVTLGFVPPLPKFLDGSMVVPHWLENREARIRLAQNLPRFEYGKYCFLISAPLTSAHFEPQAIIIYGNPAQIMRLVQAAVYQMGEPVVSTSYGAGGCATYISKAILTEQCQFILSGAGDRIFGLTQDDEMCFSIPFSQIEDVLKGLEATHKADMRYPITSFLRFKAELPQPYVELMTYLEGEREK